MGLVVFSGWNGVVGFWDWVVISMGEVPLCD